LDYNLIYDIILMSVWNLDKICRGQNSNWIAEKKNGRVKRKFSRSFNQMATNITLSILSNNSHQRYTLWCQLLSILLVCTIQHKTITAQTNRLHISQIPQNANVFPTFKTVPVSQSWHRGSNVPSSRSLAVDKEKTKPGHWFVLVLLCLVLSHFWLGGRKDIQPTKPRSSSPQRFSFGGGGGRRSKPESADPGSPGKMADGWKR